MKHLIELQFWLRAEINEMVLLISVLLEEITRHYRFEEKLSDLAMCLKIFYNDSGDSSLIIMLRR